MTVNRMSKTSLVAPTKYRNFRAGNVEVTGGILSEDATYYYRTFKSSGTLGVAGGTLIADVLVVAGGGGGAAGGGAGGLLTATSYSISTGALIPVTVGAGGAGGVWAASGSSGTNSVFNTMTAIGGGYGGGPNVSGGNGGSGGGSGSTSGSGVPAASSGTVGQGYAGGVGTASSNQAGGGGGGGAGSTGGNYPAGTGGSGVKWLDGSFYAGGGGSGNTASAGGIGGGGTGSSGTAGSGTNGTANTGGGGGGTIFGTPGTGGSGIVVIRYPKTSITSTFADYELIGTVNVTSAQTLVTFTGISQQYKHLQMRIAARNNANVGGDDMLLQFNGDSTYTNYRTHYMYGSGGSGTAVSSATIQSASFPGANISINTSDASSTAGAYNAIIVDILDPFSSSKFKTVRALSGAQSNTGNQGITLNSAVWMSTAPVTSITVQHYVGSSSFAIGSRVSLYGIRG